ncbi:MAG: type VII secretion protein EssC [Mogibacterium sp.]|nr:type VII secretion protein EssC [Mogibacterium sp.]
MDIRLGTPSPSVEVELHSEYCSDTLAVISNDNGKYILREDKSRYGINVNGTRITKPTVLKDHDFFSISDVFFYFKEGSLYTDNSKVVVRGVPHELLEKSTFHYPVFVRNTRRKVEPDKTPIKILDPSKKPIKPELNIITSLLPMVMMLILIIVVRGYMSSSGGSFVLFSACSMGLGVITSIITMVQGQKKYKKEVAERERVYSKYIEEKEAEIIRARQAEADILHEIYRPQDESIRKVMEFESDIFDRIPEDDDYMDVLLGYGRRKAERLIEYKKQEKLEEDDEMTLIPEQVAEKYKYIDNAPIYISLRSVNAVGITGSEDERFEFFKVVLTDLICRQFSNEIEFFLLVGEDSERYEWIKRLPQLQRPDGRRNVVFDSNTRTNTFDYLYKELSARYETDKPIGKNFVVFTLDNNGIYNHPISKYIQEASKIKTTFLFFESRLDYLPLYCSEVIELKGNGTGVCFSSSNRTDSREFTYSHITDSDIAALVEKIAPVYSEEISLASSLRKSLTMYEMLGIYNANDLDIENSWSESKVFKSMAAPLGVNSKDEIVYLDLHEKAHGPHGLVAGTTGSGKSEILQTYILSMASRFHPYEVSFVIIDFKGGGMANQMADLPHMIGTITNIDGKEIDRSLKSIKAELLKRQTMFAEAGVNHIDKYIKEYKEGNVDVALPHLIIIVDEFAELKAEQPEFMKELISASRIGRSLGVHLILATQKPSGQVNEQIWSNSRFKLCLKVQTPEDSNEVLKSPLAAEILEPGRAYMQVGNNELFELLQSGYSGASENMEESVGCVEVSELDFSGARRLIYKKKAQKSAGGRTQLEAIVSHIRDSFDKSGDSLLSPICLPSLPEQLNGGICASDTIVNYSVPIGLYDDPDHQLQNEAYFDLGVSNALIIGSAQYGKTNLLELLIRNLSSAYSPVEVNMYIVDFGSMVLKNLEKLPHVGGVVLPSDDEKIKNLFKYLSDEIQRRKTKLMNAGISSMSHYREMGYSDFPQIIVFIDNISALKELSLQDSDILLELCREGLSVGVTFVVTSVQTSGLGYKYMTSFSTRLAFTCNEPSEYASLFGIGRIHPENIPGRCLIEIKKNIYECQTYLAFEGEKESDRMQKMQKYVEDMETAYSSLRAYPIPEIPEQLLAASLEEYTTSSMQNIVVGLDYASVEPVTVDLMRPNILALCGPDGSGRSNFIRYFIEQILKKDEDACIYIFDDYRKKLSSLCEHAEVEAYDSRGTKFIDVISAIETRLQDAYQNLIVDEEDPDESHILVINNADVIEAISSDKNALATVKNMIGKYKMLHTFVLIGCMPNSQIGFAAPELYKIAKENRSILFFDNLEMCKIADIPAAEMRNNKKRISTGDAFYIHDTDIYKIKTPLL